MIMLVRIWCFVLGSAHQGSTFGEAIRFYGEQTKIILELSSNILL